MSSSSRSSSSQTLDEGHDSMRMGWTGTFEQLEQYLAKTKA
jgi:hypothetical protein